MSTSSNSVQQPDGKKKKKILVKKKKNAASHSTVSQSETQSNTDPIYNMFALSNGLNNLCVDLKQKIEKMPDKDLEEIENNGTEKFVQDAIKDFEKSKLPEGAKNIFSMINLGSTMSILFKNAEKMAKGEIENETKQTSAKQVQKDPNAPPSVYDVEPEAPTEKSGKYSNIEDEKKNHLVYKGINATFLKILTMLGEKLPEKRHHYDNIHRIIEKVIDLDPTKPYKMWAKVVKTEEEKEKLYKYSEDNVTYILKNLKNIEFLSLLELDGEWHRFTSTDYKTFWTELSHIQMLCEMVENIEPELMTSVQNMSIRFTQGGFVKQGENGIQNMPQVIGQLANEIFKDQGILKGMTKTMHKMNKVIEENAIPTAPSYDNLEQKAHGNL